MSLLLVGAGGHARVIAEMVGISAYVDPKPAAWLDCQRFGSDSDALSQSDGGFVLGIGCASPGSCQTRRQLGESYLNAGLAAPVSIHRAAVVSPTATVGEGSQVLPCAVIQANSVVGRFCLINAGAIVDHDCFIGDGAHVATGAILGGGVRVGRDCMIGMGAIVLPYTEIPDATLVKAGTRYPQ